MLRVFIFLLGLLPFLSPQIASAHAFGQLYNLPVPFWMYLYGGAAALVVSFVIIGYFFNKTDKNFFYPTRNLPFLHFLTQSWFLTISKIVSVSLLLLTLLTGLLGVDDATSNFNMNFFWIIFVLGFTYVVGLFGNIWQIVNPWKALAEWIEAASGKHHKERFTYPKKLSYYPALVMYFLFIWIELFGRTTPLSLSLILLLYTCINAVGIRAWGKQNWFHYGEFFSVFYSLLGKMAFLEYRKNKIYLRPPFVGLLNDKPEHFTLVIFILFMLSSTAFDGFHSIISWVLFISGLPSLFGESSYDIYQTIGLLLSPFIFLSAYGVLVYLAKVIIKSKTSLMQLCLDFAFSLIPIAFVYNVAHYYTLLITEGQNTLRLISDPFGVDWNLFGTAGNFDIYIPDANFIWHSQVGLILLGHIVGVYIAHMIALRLFPTHKKALLSQIPVLLLMVLYTMTGLWILSQPII